MSRGIVLKAHRKRNNIHSKKCTKSQEEQENLWYYSHTQLTDHHNPCVMEAQPQIAYLVRYGQEHWSFFSYQLDRLAMVLPQEGKTTKQWLHFHQSIFAETFFQKSVDELPLPHLGSTHRAKALHQV